jgi:KipI family sensor histidine kinase inhibitor
MLRLHPYGDVAVLVETDDVHRVTAAARRIENVVDVVPGAETVVVIGADVDELSARLEAASLSSDEALPPSRQHEIAVHYNGPDLAEVAALTRLSIDDVVARHSGRDYEVAFLGFAPGFGYLRGLDPALCVPRRATPRTAVPTGSVAIADQWSAVYPRPSPGGWRLLGRTDVVLFDPTDEARPCRLAPGDVVRFRPQ